MNVTCTRCGKTWLLRPEADGQPLECPKCHAPLPTGAAVPSAGGAPGAAGAENEWDINSGDDVVLLEEIPAAMPAAVLIPAAAPAPDAAAAESGKVVLLEENADSEAAK